MNQKQLRYIFDLQQLGVVVIIGGATTAKNMQVFVAHRFDAVRGSWQNKDAVANADRELLLAQCHATAAGSDVVDLFSALVGMPFCTLAGLDNRFGKALVVATVQRWVKQFANFGTVLGSISRDVGVVGQHGLKQCRLRCHQA
jgi:hypothetical protein